VFVSATIGTLSLDLGIRAKPFSAGILTSGTVASQRNQTLMVVASKDGIFVIAAAPSAAQTTDQKNPNACRYKNCRQGAVCYP
jgi:hypothetical protein